MTVTISANQVSQPQFVPTGSLVTITPASGATATVEYTKDGAAAVMNGVARWTVWPKGSVTSAATDISNSPVHLRVTASGGDVAIDIDTSRQSSLGADWGAPVTLHATSRSFIPRIVTFGDSYDAYEAYDWPGDGSSRCTMDSALWHVALAMLGHHRFKIVAQAGIGGNTTGSIGQASNSANPMRSRFQSDVMQNEFDILLGNGGVNDFFGYDRKVDDVLADVTSMISTALAAGKTVIWANCPTQGTGRTNTTGKTFLSLQKKALEYNRRLAAWAIGKRNLYVLDLARSVMNMSDTTNAAPRTGHMWTDGIHLHFNGAYRFAKDNFALLDSLFPSFKRPFAPLEGVGDGYSGSTLIAGVGAMQGTSGIISGTGVSGTVPTGWTGKRSGSGSTATCVFSTVADKDGDWIQGAITGNGAASLETFSIIGPNMSAQYAPGDACDVSAELQLDMTGGLTVQQFYLRDYFFNGASIIYSDWNRTGGGNTSYQLDGVETFMPRTPTVVLPAGYTPTSANLYYEIYVMGTGTATFRIRNARPAKNLA